MSRHIFKQKQDQPLPQQSSTPKCHYHNHPITHFCIRKSCTLPLCKDCLPIHRIQHKNSKKTTLQGIIELQVAKEDSLAAFRSRKNEILAVQQQFTQKLMEYKKTIISVVDAVVNSFLQNSLTADGGLEILSEIEQRTVSIKKGSLKQLIKYYQDFYDPEKIRKMYAVYSGDYLTHLNYKVDKIDLSEIIKKSITLNLNQNNEVPKRENESQQNIIIEDDDRLAYEITFDAAKQRQSIKEEDIQSSIESYQLFKSKMKQQSEYLNSKRDNKIIEALPSHHSHHINQINEPQRSKQKKRKGLSLVKSHSQLPNSSPAVLRQKSHSQLPNRSQPVVVQKSVNFTTEQIVNKKLNENLSVKKRQSFPQKIAPQHIQVLNPKQMRELIAKRKTMEKARRMEQLIKNNSNEIMMVSATRYKS